jgi:mannose-6-phosphate isomerase-like protein (cupin superfamily)
MESRSESAEARSADDGTAGLFFEITNGFEVADTTTVFPFLNGNDAKSGLRRGRPESFSMTVGLIHPTRSSKIHVHPVVTQVTMVLDGCLEVWLGGPSLAARRSIRLLQNQAVLVRPGTFLQLVNPSLLPCRTLYVVGPAYVADVDEQGNVTYEDAVTLDESWDELEATGWSPPRLQNADVTPERRAAALARVRERQAANERNGS